MLTPAIVNIVSFFYPIGNTPAVSLTQAIPPNVPAAILLLGCGDVRNILFTSHIDANRSMDITCCDIQKAVIARNILLLSLIIDDDDGQNDGSIWSIYYHIYLDKEAQNLLQSQAKKLCELSATMDTWQQGKYGSRLKFCDSATLADVRKMWEFYSVSQKGIELFRLKNRLDAIVQQAQKHKTDKELSMTLTGFRSAAPAYIGALPDIDALYRHYWKYGSTELNEKTRANANYPNPMFLTLEDDATIHYGTDPLLGFHLATAYAPLYPEGRLPDSLKGLNRVVTAARLEFGNWMTSYRKHAANITIRLFVGDAVSLAHTLQHKRLTGAITANWYRSQYHLRPLVLDGPDYASSAAPLTFDVIDTSNLCDHLGSLVLLTATSPLLRNHVSSALYTEVIVKQQKNHNEILDNMLCGHVPTMSTLLGLFPVEYWTNTSLLSPGDEGMMDVLMGNTPRAINGESDQMYLRTCWKRPVCLDGPSGPCAGLLSIQFDADQLAHVLYQVYVCMFRDEDFALRFANISLEAIWRSSLVWYHRASFASFLRLVKTRVTCDWAATMNALIELIHNRPNAPMGMNYIQEFFIYLHMLDVFSTDILEEWHSRQEIGSQLSPELGPVSSRITSVDGNWGDLRDWKNMPPVVCVTLKVPRKKLSVFTNINRNKLGTPAVHGLLQHPYASGMNGWQNIFPACQLAFGDIQSSGKPYDDSFAISVTEDNLGWKGTSALVVAFYVPSFFLLLEPRKAVVAFGVHSTPMTTMVFASKLGLVMNVYETTLDNFNNVFVTRYAPDQTGFPTAPGFARAELTAPGAVNPGADTCLIASVDERTGHIATLTGRLDINSDGYNSSLKSGCQVRKSSSSPYQVAVTLGVQTPLVVCFPVFVVEATQKTRIARKSSYIEIVAKVAPSSEWMNYPYFMYPVHLQHGKPTSWNMPYLELRQCPIIDTKQRNKLDWFTPHVSLAMSSRERALRQNAGLPRSGGEQIRLDFKETLFSIFIQFAGLQGEKHHVFGLNNAANGGVHILILISSLRMDIPNRTIVLDCAVLPLHDEIMPQIHGFLAALSSRGLCQVKVNDTELELWRRALPAYVERCRTWAHRVDCEYAKTGTVPRTVENGKPFLCTCGNGKVPSNFISGVAHWDTVSKHAVRAAISPSFWAPFADDIYRPDLTSFRSQSYGGGAGVGCGTCGKTQGEEGTDLLNCARCMKVKYCSRECQRADWGAHKPACK